MTASSRGRAGVLALTIALGGCADLPVRSEDPLLPGGEIDRQVIADFAAALADAHEPRTTTFQVSRSTHDPVTIGLVEELVALGFGIQRVAQDQGARFIDHQRDIVLPRHGGTRVDDRLTIGTFETQRSFNLTDDGRIDSATPTPSDALDQAARDPAIAQNTVVVSRVVSSANVGTTNRVLAWPESDRLGTPGSLMPVVTQHAVESEVADYPDGLSLREITPSAAQPNNRFYGGDSAFADQLEGFERIERRTLVFANDSLQLGRTNKRMLARWLASRFRQDDRLSLIGCSTGHTAMAIGNEGLALGRADRVIEELLAHGVKRRDIYSEGCWAPVSAGDAFPGRGVVLELWRRTS